MEQRQLGTNGPHASALGLGCWGLSGTYGSVEERDALAVIDRAIALGITFIDTADTYGAGHNEGLVKQALAGRRGEVFLATKFGRTFGEGSAERRVNGSPEYVRSACDASLRRLGVDVIDLYYYHRVDPQVPIEETVGTMAELVLAGKVRHLGLSEANPAQIRRAVKIHPIAALQTEWSLFTRDIEQNGILATIRELGIAIVPYSPLGRGILSGRVRSLEALDPSDNRQKGPRFKGDALTANLSVVDRLVAYAEGIGLSGAQFALAWLLSQGADVFPIPGTKRVTYLDENAKAEATRLTAVQLSEIDAIAPAGVAVGARTADPLTPLSV